METYSVKEAAEIVGISIRAVQKRCLRGKIRKKSNRYLITDKHINSWREERKANELKTNQNEPEREPVRINQLDLEVESLKAIISDLKAKLSEYDISDNERIEVFTNDEYDVFKERLQEWFTMQKDMQHKQQLFDVEKMSLTEMLDHYKNQFEYQKKQSEKILQMHQKLIDTIDKQNSLAIQRNIIEAKEKDVINKDWKANK